MSVLHLGLKYNIVCCSHTVCSSYAIIGLLAHLSKLHSKST